jgi:hypothetical protein
MAYNLVKSDGTPLATIADGQTNTTATSLTLVGKNFAGYGTFLNENFVKLLENFASANEPANPKAGQLWYQTSTRLLQVYNGNSWKSISGAQSVADEPTFKVSGDLWFDSVNQQLKVWSGAGWVVIGPSFTSTTGTSGAVADTVIDSSQFSHVVVKFFVQNQLVAVLSKDSTFQPATTIPGFPSIKPGLNLARGTSPELIFYENANNAAFLGSLAANQYLTKDNALLTSKLVIRNNDGIELEEPSGTVTNAQLNINNNNIQLVSLVRGNGFIIRTKPDNAGGAFQTVLSVDKVTGLISVLNDPTDPSGISTKNYVDNRDNATRTMLQNNVVAINSNVSVLAANTTVVYGNVRTIQSHLGFRKGGPGTQTDNQYTEMLINNNDSIVGNLFALWGNVQATAANVLTGTTGDGGPGGTNTSSMYANVRLLQGKTSSLENDALRRDGTLSITGDLRPDITATRSLGTGSFRFTSGFINQVSLGSTLNDAANLPAGTIVNLRSVNATGSRGKFDPIQIVGNPITLTGNIFFNDNVDGSPTANAALGVAGPLRVQGTLSHQGDINSTGNNLYDIGTSGTKYRNIFVTTVNADTLSLGSGGLNSTAAATFGQLTVQGSVLPQADGTFDIGAVSPTNLRWRNVYAGTFNSSLYTSLTTTGITWGGSSQTADIGTSSIRFRDVFAQEFYGTGVEVRTNGIFTTGTAVDIGTNSNKFKDVYATNFFGTASAAKYADLAERFESDAEYSPGTLVRIGGEKEITIEQGICSADVLGVITTSPAYMMNSEAGDDSTHPGVAMTGRVPVRVLGAVNKGDRLVSGGSGCARKAYDSEVSWNTVIGRALESKDSSDEALVLCIVNVSM